MEGRAILSQGIIRRIGDGQDTNIWSHNWITRDSNLRPITTPSEDCPIKVSELIDSTSACWNDEKLAMNFLPTDVDVIKKIPIPTASLTDSWA